MRLVMRIRISTDLVLALSTAALLMTLGACKKEESDPETIPVDTATVEEAEPTEDTSTADTATADDSADAAPAATPTVVTTAKKAPPKGSSIDACCGALRSRAMIGGDARTKQASAMCASIAKLVKEGKTSRQAALTQIRSAAGGKVPAACN